MFKKTVLSALIASAFGGCILEGDETDGNNDTGPTAVSGVFVDSPVAGMAYTSGDQSGMTGADGSFVCEKNDTVTFKVGNIQLPSLICGTDTEVVTPLTVFETTDIDDERVQNLARFLQTLDSNGNPDDGINISELAHTSANAVTTSIDFSSATFDADIAAYVTDLHNNGGTSNATLVSAESANTHLQTQMALLGSIVGTWTVKTGSGRATLTFLSNGEYIHAEVGADDEDGQTGIEHGTYTWDASVGAFASTCPSVDTNGQWGLSHPDGDAGCTGINATAKVSGNTLAFDAGGGDTFSVSRVIDATNPIVGSWYATLESGANVLFTFFSNGAYFHAEDSNPDENGQNGMERGTYTWNATSGEFTSTCPTIDTNGQWGLSDPDGDAGCTGSTTTVTITGNTMTLDGTLTFTRVTP